MLGFLIPFLPPFVILSGFSPSSSMNSFASWSGEFGLIIRPTTRTISRSSSWMRTLHGP